MGLIGKILDLLFPPKCAFCGQVLEGKPGTVCPKCVGELPWTRGREAERKGEFYRICVSPLWYQDKVRDSIHRYKFSQHTAYAKTYGALVATCVAQTLEGKYDMVTWVPLSAKKKGQRGYDQSLLLGKEVAPLLQQTLVPTLEKVRQTKTQSHLSDFGHRRANVMGVYRVRPDAPVVGRKILLLDDVVTSGATLSECARMLLMAGAEDVVCATVAKTRGKERASSKKSKDKAPQGQSL